MRQAILGAAALLTITAGAAQASPQSDALSKCLVDKTSAGDRTLLVQWVYADMSLSPAVRAMSNVTEAQRDALARDAAHLLERLVTGDCRGETVAALKQGGLGVIKTSFGALAERAMGELATDPPVAMAFAHAVQFMDMKKVALLMVEAGSMRLPKLR